jgi:signal transduction histidine kinase
VSGRRRFLERFPSIRAKLGFVIVFAVGMTVLLIYLLLGYALSNSSRDRDRLQLLDTAQQAAVSRSIHLPAGVWVLLLSTGGRWSWSTPPPGLPLFTDRAVHVGSQAGFDYVAVPGYAREGRQTRTYVGTVYAIRKAPGGFPDRIADTFGFLRHYWWQLLLGGALAAGTALTIARFLALGMTQPLRDMAGAAGKMARGDYGQRVTTRSRDEVGQLAAAFNRMSGELEQVERLRRDLVANVSHELKTPISALRAHLENLLDGVEQPDPETIQVMLQQSERLSRLVEQLLDLSRLESGDLPMALGAVPLRPLVDQVISEVEVAAAARGATVARPANSVAGDLPPVLGDAERIHQVLYNLLANAVRFTPPDGTVSVTAALSGDRCEVTVADTGHGIPPEHLPFVFERFYRADAARARERGGTGIGLAIVRSIVEAHGGTVRAQSDAGKGSAFTFDLPLAGTPATAGLPPAAASAEPLTEAGARTDAPSADTVGATRAGARTGGTE